MVYTSTKLRAAEPVLRGVAQRIRRAPGQHVVKPSIRFPEPVKRGGSVQSSAWWSSRERDSIVAAVLNVLNTSNLRTQLQRNFQLLRRSPGVTTPRAAR